MPWLRAAVGFAEVVQRAQRAHTPSPCSGSKPEYLLSKYESHYHPHFCFSQITKELSAVSRASEAPEGEDGEEIPASGASGVRVH